MKAAAEKARNGKPAASDDLRHALGRELSLIFACCFLLRETLKEHLSKEQRRQLRQIERSAAAIRDLGARRQSDERDYLSFFSSPSISRKTISPRAAATTARR